MTDTDTDNSKQSSADAIKVIKKPFKEAVLERLIRIEKLTKENKEISALIFVTVIIVGAIGFISDISSIFNEDKTTVMLIEDSYSVNDLDKSDFKPEFFMYENLLGKEEISIELNASDRVLNLSGSNKYSASCDDENYNTLGWWPVEVSGECVYTSDDFYLKVISREGEVSDTFHYKIDYVDEINKYKKMKLNEHGPAFWIRYTDRYSDDNSNLSIQVHFEELAPLVEKFFIGLSNQGLDTVIQYTYHNGSFDTEILDNTIDIEDGGAPGEYILPGEIETIYAQMQYLDGDKSRVDAVNIERNNNPDVR